MVFIIYTTIVMTTFMGTANELAIELGTTGDLSEIFCISTSGAEDNRVVQAVIVTAWL